MTGMLAGTAALVTGASSGIGAATARALAAQGAAVALSPAALIGSTNSKPISNRQAALRWRCPLT